MPIIDTTTLTKFYQCTENAPLGCRKAIETTEQIPRTAWEALKRDPLKGTPGDANFHSRKSAPCKFTVLEIRTKVNENASRSIKIHQNPSRSTRIFQIEGRPPAALPKGRRPSAAAPLGSQFD